ncbi:MAG: phosphoserine phosphatase RsbU [Chlamydiales bacterium]
MAEKHIANKGSGSLAGRVAWIAILFLVIPLLVFSFVGYRMVYKTQARHILVTMDLLEQGERGVIDEFIKGQGLALDMIVANLADQVITSEKLMEYHEFFSEHESAQNLFYLKDGICLAASSSEFVGKNFTKFLDNRARLAGGHDLFTAKVFFNQKETILLGKAMPKGYILIAYPINQLLDMLAIVKDEEYPVNFSLINPYGEVIGSTDEAFNGQVFAEGGVPMELIESPAEMQFKEPIEAFRFSFEGRRWAGVMKPVAGSEYQLLFAVGAKFVFLSFNRFIHLLVYFFGSLLIVGFPLALLFTRRFSRPLRDLTEIMALVGRGKTHYRYEPDRYGYEINYAGKTFNEMIETLLHTQRLGEEQRVAKEGLEKEFAIGQEVQQSLIPESLPELAELEITARYLPAKEVSGDFYDLFQREDGKWLIVMADVSGKGIHACFYALLLRSMLRSFGYKNSDLAEVLGQTNQLFSMDTEPHGVFATAWVGVFDPINFSLSHVSCGHPPAYILRADGHLDECNNRVMSLGVAEITEFPIERTELHPGDQLFLYTDGLSEMHNLKNGLFGEDRIKAFLVEKQTLPTEEFLADLFEEMAWFSEGAPQHDDLSFILIKRFLPNKNHSVIDESEKI